jgi:CheY-like chemotaxis protein
VNVEPILLVDSDSEWREHLSSELERWGLRTLSVAFPDEALALVRKAHFSVVLLDANALAADLMFELDAQGVPKVVLTHAPAQDIGGLLACPGIYYLPKMASLRHLFLLLEALDVAPLQDAVA